MKPVLSLDSQQELFNEALKYTSNGQFNVALKKWDEYISIYPEDPQAFSNRGNVKLVLGDSEGSIMDQDESINLSPDELDPYINKGIAKEAQSLWADAKEQYEYVLRRDEENSSALYNLANVEGSLSNWKIARDLFQKASDVQPGFAMARSSLALVNYQLGNFEIAEAELRKLIRRYPTFADARAALTALQWSRGKFGEAESNWIAASELDARYFQKEWLLNVRRWPPNPTRDLMKFIDLQ
tara:strand:- start:1716 stop:2438 length:723 start_codon:yes stop_codon:yes gene_type:complete